MRNLELLRSFPVLELDGLESSFCLTVDSECGVIYTATNSGVTGFQPSNQQVYLKLIMISVIVSLHTLLVWKWKGSTK